MSHDNDAQPSDAGLRKLFGELKERDAPRTPSFASTWVKATPLTRGGRWRPQLAWAGAGFAALAALAVVAIRPANLAERAPARGGGTMTSVQEPLRFLLAPPTSIAVAELRFDADPLRYELDRVLENARKEPLR